VVCEPIHAYRIEAPADCLSGLLDVLGRLASIGGSVVTGPLVVLTGEVAAARLPAIGRRIPGLSHGEGLVESSFIRFEPVRDTVAPRRDRHRPDPLERRNYLLATAGRAPG
jgi:ribosomal protection tetracycline resistance protein